MHERVGRAGLRAQLEKEASQWSQILPQIPRLVHAKLAQPDSGPGLNLELERMRRAQEQTNSLSITLLAVIAVGLGVEVWALTRQLVYSVPVLVRREICARNRSEERRGGNESVCKGIS